MTLRHNAPYVDADPVREQQAMLDRSNNCRAVQRIEHELERLKRQRAQLVSQDAWFKQALELARQGRPLECTDWERLQEQAREHIAQRAAIDQRIGILMLEHAEAKTLRSPDRSPVRR